MASVTMFGETVAELEAEAAALQKEVDDLKKLNEVVLPGREVSSQKVVDDVNAWYYAQIGREMVESMQFNAGAIGSGKTKANDSWIVPAAIGAAVLVLGLGVLSAKG